MQPAIVSGKAFRQHDFAAVGLSEFFGGRPSSAAFRFLLSFAFASRASLFRVQRVFLIQPLRRILLRGFFLELGDFILGLFELPTQFPKHLLLLQNELDQLTMRKLAAIRFSVQLSGIHAARISHSPQSAKTNSCRTMDGYRS